MSISELMYTISKTEMYICHYIATILFDSIDISEFTFQKRAFVRSSELTFQKRAFVHSAT